MLTPEQFARDTGLAVFDRQRQFIADWIAKHNKAKREDV